MEISFIQAILIGIIYYLGVNGTPWLTLLGSTILNRPLICGTMVGVVLGDPIQGCIIGAAINLPYLAYISAGGTVPVDPGLAGTLGTALALVSGVDPQVAVTLAVPIGLLGTVVWIVHMTVDISFLHMVDKAASKGDINKLGRIHLFFPQIFLFIIAVIPVALIAYFGSDVIRSLLSSISGKPLHVLQVIGGVLPALGIAMILKSINSSNVIIFYALGCLLAVYFNLPIIALAVFGFIVAFIYTQLFFKNN